MTTMDDIFGMQRAECARRIMPFAVRNVGVSAIDWIGVLDNVRIHAPGRYLTSERAAVWLAAQVLDVPEVVEKLARWEFRPATFTAALELVDKQTVHEVLSAVTMVAMQMEYRGA